MNEDEANSPAPVVSKGARAFTAENAGPVKLLAPASSLIAAWLSGALNPDSLRRFIGILLQW